MNTDKFHDSMTEIHAQFNSQVIFRCFHDDDLPEFLCRANEDYEIHGNIDTVRHRQTPVF